MHFFVALLGILIGILVVLGIFSLVFWGVGSLIVWIFGINYTWTFFHGVACSIVYILLRNFFSKE